MLRYVKSRFAFPVLCAAALAAVIAGCGSSGSSSGSSGESGGKQVAMVLANKSDPFFLTMKCGAEEEAKKTGTDLTVQLTNDYSPDQQTEAVDGVIASEPEALVIDPMDPKAMFPPVDQANHGGAQIVTVDGTLEDNSVNSSEIVSDDVHAGEVAAEELAKEVGEKGKVLMVALLPGVPPVEHRIEGFEKGMEKYPDITVLPVQYDNAEPTRAATIVSATLARDPDLVGIFSENPPAVQGTITALRQAGKNGQIKHVAFDGSPTTIEGLEEGEINAIIVQEPRLEGQLAVQQALAAIEGKPTKETIVTPVLTIDQQSLESAKAQDTIWKSTC
jgi:ribose transport system substrate-binding protein